jgi:hypothetical protein
LKIINNITLFLATFLIVLSCSAQKSITVSYSNPAISYEGRIDSLSTPNATDIYWSGSSIKINFEGATISALLEDENGKNYFTVIIDNDSISTLKLTSEKKQYKLASNLSEGKHTVELFKRTQFNMGKTSFYEFQIENNAKLLPKPINKKRKIEIYGNSISAGYGIDDLSGKSRGDNKFTNNYLAYGAITARYFNAEYNCICKGGIGIMISWFPYTMPDIYDRLIPLDKNSKWDFENYTPDIVVVNLFQNDSWLVNRPNKPEFKTAFGSKPPTGEYIINSYKKFISDIRKKYPNANIICALGNMDATKEDSKWPIYISEAVKALNDKKIHTLFVPYKDTPGHPSKKEQQQIADALINYIENNIDW